MNNYPDLEFGPIFAGLQKTNEKLLQSTVETLLGAATQSVVQQQLESIQQSFSQTMRQVIDQQTQALQEAFASFTEIADRLLEDAKGASKAIGQPLIEAGFWIPPSAALELSHRLKALVETGQATPANIRAIIVEYYEAEAYIRLTEMVQAWEINPHFTNRLPIIRAALSAHIAGQYVLSIPSLLPQVEGILTGIVGKRTKADGRIEQWAENAIKGGYGELELEAYKDALLKYITGMEFYGAIPSEYFTSANYGKWLDQNGLTERQVVNRHAILHGVQIDYASKENSLRVFFILDVLAWISNDRA